MTKVDHVTARFGGVERVFRYPRTPVGGPNPFSPDTFSPYGAFQRFGAGVWTIEDLLRVLSPRKDQISVWRPDADVIAVVEAGGPANYAPLAARVLEACLFGVTPAASRWDERKPFAFPGNSKAA